jgi:hypothetical protein
MISRASVMMLSLAVLSACSQTRTAAPLPSVSAIPAQHDIAIDDLDSDASGGFGVGLATAGYLYGPGFSDSFQFCQTPGYQFTGCPGHMPGLTTTTFRYRKIREKKYESADVATASLGRFEFRQEEAADGYPSGYSSGADNVMDFHWTDTLHINSRTLAAGTRVTLDVSLGLAKPHSSVGCYRFGPSTGGLRFHGTGVDAYGQHLNLEGFCYWPSDGYYGEFIYHAGDMYTQQPIDDGTITTAVGKSVKIGAIGSVGSQACGSDSCTYQAYSGLSGVLTWRIKRITDGATYTTDSGATYTR